MSKEPMEFLKHIADECNYLLSVHTLEITIKILQF
jgi:hypothetical protein